MINIETKRVSWQLTEGGITHAFKCAVTGTDLADTTQSIPFCRLVSSNGELIPRDVTWRNNHLQVLFSDNVQVELAVETRDDYIVLRVVKAPEREFEQLVFLDVPLAGGAATRDEFVAGAVALNLLTRVDELPGPQTRLYARCYTRFGMLGAGVAVAASPFEEMRAILKTVMNEASDLPKSSRGGPWALDARENYTSYLFGVASEETVDEWIALCRDFGIDQLHFCGRNAFRYGDYLPDPAMFPKGVASVRPVIARLHQAGIMAGLHTLSFSIDQATPYVTPVPDKRLATESVFTLAKPLSADAQELYFNENTAHMPRATSYYIRRSMTLRIDDELIEYTQVCDQPPFGVAGCKRGAWGTVAASHNAGTPVHLLCACWGKFAPAGNATLFGEIAGNIAHVVNECEFDMVYLDGLDGAHIFDGEESRWHYGGRFAFEVFKRLQRPVIMEMAAFLHHLWFWRSRMGAWDHPIRGFTPFMNHHVRSNAQCARIFLPAHLGWWAPRVAHSINLTTTDIEKMSGLACKNETTFAEDVSYLCEQALVSRAGFSLQGITPEAVRATPHLSNLAPIFKRYVQARAAKDQTDIKDKTPDRRSPRRQELAFTALPQRHTVSGLDDGSQRWQIHSPDCLSSAKIRIEALWSAAPYADPRGIVLAAFKTPDEFSPGWQETRILNSGKIYTYAGNAPGMSMSLELGNTSLPLDARVKIARLTAVRQGARRAPVSSPTDQLSILDHGERIYAEHSASWAWLGRQFSPGLDLTQCPALGLWVCADADDAVLNVQTVGPKHTQGMEDHYIPLNFKGWRYVELVEPESERFELYGWPYGRCVYDIYRSTLQYHHVAGINLWLNNVPADSRTSCILSEIRALPVLKNRLDNLKLQINTQAIELPGTLATGEWLEIFSDGIMKKFAPDGSEILSQPLPVGSFALTAGVNQLAFHAKPETGNGRVRVTTLLNPDLVLNPSFA